MSGDGVIRLFSILLFLTFVLFSSLDISAQSRGGAAKGGGLARERVSDSPRTVVIPEIVKYRFALKKLNIDEDWLISQYKDSQEEGRKLSLKSFILTHLVARQTDEADFAFQTEGLISAMESGKSLEQSIQQVYSASRRVAVARKRQAEKLFSEALKGKD